jgi:hypothetical protein
VIQKCPVCGREVKPNLRYPRYVCPPCIKRSTALGGEKIEFFQAGALGLLAGRYSATGEEYMSADCFIDDMRCTADVARFGGIVIQAA